MAALGSYLITQTAQGTLPTSTLQRGFHLLSSGYQRSTRKKTLVILSHPSWLKKVMKNRQAAFLRNPRYPFQPDLQAKLLVHFPSPITVYALPRSGQTIPPVKVNRLRVSLSWKVTFTVVGPTVEPGWIMYVPLRSDRAEYVRVTFLPRKCGIAEVNVPARYLCTPLSRAKSESKFPLPSLPKNPLAVSAVVGANTWQV